MLYFERVLVRTNKHPLHNGFEQSLGPKIAIASRGSSCLEIAVLWLRLYYQL